MGGYLVFKLGVLRVVIITGEESQASLPEHTVPLVPEACPPSGSGDVMHRGLLQDGVGPCGLEARGVSCTRIVCGDCCENFHTIVPNSIPGMVSCLSHVLQSTGVTHGLPKFKCVV